MKRRAFITLVGGAAAWPLASGAQQPTVPVIGVLGTASRQSETIRMNAFREGIAQLGYVEGRNLAIEYRGAEGQYDRLPALATELVQREVSVIATSVTSRPRWRPNRRPPISPSSSRQARNHSGTVS